MHAVKSHVLSVAKIPAVSVDDTTQSPSVDLSLLSVIPTGPAPSVSSFAVNNRYDDLFAIMLHSLFC